LGFDSYFISAVGRDEPGQQALRQAEALGVDMAYTRRHPALPTGIVDVTLLDGHPFYHLRRPAAWEEPEISTAQAAALLALKPDWLVCGTLQQTCPQARQARLALNGIPIFYDVNLRPGFEDPATVGEMLTAATAVKCNGAELDWLAREFHLGGDPAEALLGRYKLALLCVTLGADGCRLYAAGGERVSEKPRPVAAVDTVGAGDAFSAALLHGLSSRWPLRQTARFANALGSIVASRPGAIPDWTREELDRAALAD
jgi:fructokinase